MATKLLDEPGPEFPRAEGLDWSSGVMFTNIDIYIYMYIHVWTEVYTDGLHTAYKYVYIYMYIFMNICTHTM